jgi:methylmalonyl-CoA/ethylmalonyl-CoA epimerase
MRVHHIGYIVRSMVEAKEIFSSMGYEVFDSTTDNRRDIEIAFVNNENVLVELIMPLSDKAVVNSYLKKNGPTPYHICYLVNNLESQLENMRSNGFIIVEKPEAAPALENRKVAFLFHKDIGLVELLEEDRCNE